MAEKEELKLSQKELKLRDFILSGSPLLVIIKLGIPVAMYQGINQLFRIFDSFIASQINATAASTVTFFSQINSIIGGIGMGLAAGAALQISNAYGLGDYPLVKKRVSSTLALTVISCVAVALILIPLITPFMYAISTPREFIDMGRDYFIADLIGTLVSIINAMYIAIQRAKGNTKILLYLNVGATVVKFSLTLLSVYVFHQGITFIAISTILSQIVILVAAIITLTKKGEVFSFSLKEVSFRSHLIGPLLLLSFPIMVEKSAFSLGKVVVNSMITAYGPLTVGALGISNLICGVTTSPQNGFQDTTAAVISQNYGANQIRRTFDALKSMILVTVIFGTICFLPSWIFRVAITGIFAPGDPVFHDILLNIFKFDIWSIFPLAINTSIIALLYGFGYTKITLLINFCRVFLFRIPVLWLLQNFTDLGSESAGVVMIVSNLLVAFLSIIIGIIYVRKISKKYGIPFLKKEFA